ncbi:MAG: hypothetical protein GXN99_01845 [Candidatus Nanohaloarchaeota archaeon]|nr:hypothetical protein [Candidatus Nanohaloarchaeota archaeon]
MILWILFTAVFLVLSIYFMFASHFFSISYANIFQLSSIFSSVHLGFLIGFIITFSLLLSIVSLLFLKRRDQGYYFLMPLIIFNIFFFVFYPKSVVTYVIILIDIIAILYFSRIVYLRKSWYKEIPYPYLSYELIKKILLVFSISLAIIFTYEVVQTHDTQDYVDSFFYSQTGLWLNKSDVNLVIKDLEEASSQSYDDILDSFGSYVATYVMYASISAPDECSKAVEEAIDSLKEQVHNQSSLNTSNDQINKIKMLLNYREMFLKLYPYIVFGLYYALFSLLFWIVGLISYGFSYLLNDFIEE